MHVYVYAYTQTHTHISFNQCWPLTTAGIFLVIFLAKFYWQVVCYYLFLCMRENNIENHPAGFMPRKELST